MKPLVCSYFCALALLVSLPAVADGVVIDKVYHPYVDALERELEYRVLLPGKQEQLETPSQIHQLSLGTSIGAKIFTEVYLVGEKQRDGTVGLQAWEVETKWQITEQGQYAADFGLLFEYEAVRDTDEREFNVGLLAEKDRGLWSGTVNFNLINETGGPGGTEFETAFATQIRRRFSPLFEPGLEFYAGEGTRAAGPVIQGNIITGVRRSLHWETGVIFGLDETSAPSTWRFLLEYEF